MRESFRSALGHGVMSVGAVALIGLVGSVLIARLYGVEVIGEYALTLAPVAVMTYLTTVQEQAALMRELSVLEPRAPRVTGLFAAVFAFSLALTVGVGVVVTAVTAWVLAGPVGRPDLVWPMVAQILGYVLVTNTCWNIDSVLNAFRSGRALFWVRLVQAAGFLALAMGLGLVADSVWGLVVATVGSWTVSLVPRVRALRTVMTLRVPWAEVRAGFAELPAIIRFGVRAAPGGVLVGANAEAGVWILGVTSSVAAVGAWNRARQLGDRVREVTIRVNEVLLPTLVERETLGDLDGRDRALVDSWRYGLGGMLLPAAVGGGAAVGIMNIFGPGFAEGASALAVILLYQALQTVDSIHVTALYARDRPGLTTLAAAAGMVVGIATAVALAGPMGPTGPAVGLVAGLITSTTVMHPTVRRGLSRPLHDLWGPRGMMAQIAAYAGGFAAARGVDMALDGHLGTLAALAAGVAAYVGAWAVVGGLEDRDRDRIAALRRRVRATPDDTVDSTPPAAPPPRADPPAVRAPGGVVFAPVVAVAGPRRAPAAVEALGGAAHVAAALAALRDADPAGRLPLMIRADASHLTTGAVAGLVAAGGRAGRSGIVVIGEAAAAARPAEALRAAEGLRAGGWAVGLGDLGGERRPQGLIALLGPQVLVMDMGIVRALGGAAAPSLAAIAAERERTGVPLVARGVDTRVQLAAAVGLGATHAQGPLLLAPGPVPASVDAPLTPSPAPPAVPAGLTPFEVVAAARDLGTGDAASLAEVSRAIEQQALRMGADGLFLTVVQSAAALTPDTRERHARLARTVPLVVTLGVGVPAEPAAGVRGVAIGADDPLRAQWVVLALGPDVAAALVAIDLGDGGTGGRRAHRFAVTHDRALVGACARTLLRRTLPEPEPRPMPGRAAVSRGSR